MTHVIIINFSWDQHRSHIKFNEGSSVFLAKNILADRIVLFSEALLTHLPGQNGRYFVEYILKRIFCNEKLWISIEISLKFILKIPIDNKSPLV